MPAGLPWGMPGIGDEIEGAMQHAPQPGRQSMPPTFRGRRRKASPPQSAWNQATAPVSYPAEIQAPHMKRIVRPLLTTLVIAFAGCAGTPTKESTGEFLDGAAITAKVKAAYVRDPLVKTFDISVETFKNTVQLAGFVDTPEQKARAEALAKAVPGVTEVKNAIMVKTAK